MGAEPVEINDCEDGSILKDGKCVPMEGGDKECPEGLEMKDGECVMKGGNFLHAGKQITVGGGNMLYSNNYSKSSLLNEWENQQAAKYYDVLYEKYGNPYIAKSKNMVYVSGKKITGW